MARLHRLFAVAVLALVGAPSSACWLEYQWRTTEGPVFLEGSITRGPSAPELLSLSIGDDSGLQLERTVDLMAALEGSDQQAQELFRLIADALAKRADMQVSIVKNLLANGTARADGVVATDSDLVDHELLLTSTMPGFLEVRIPLPCTGPCQGTYWSQWRYVREAPEPPMIALVVLASALGMGMGRTAGRRR